MNPDSPTRASPRIRAARAAAAADGSSTTAASLAGDAPQAPSHGFQTSPQAEAGGQPAVGVAPRLPHEQAPHPGQPTSTAAGPARTRNGRILPPPDMPALDPKVMEERKRQALEYAMADPVAQVGGFRGHRTATRKSSASSGSNASKSLSGGDKVTITGKNAVARSNTSDRKRGASSGGGRGVATTPRGGSKTSAASAAADSPASVKAPASKAAPPKRGPGRPRTRGVLPTQRAKAAASKANSGTKRRVGRPRKTTVTHPFHPDSPQAKEQRSKTKAKRAEEDIDAGGYGNSGIGAELNEYDAGEATRDAISAAQVLAFGAKEEGDGVANRVTQSLPNSSANSDDDEAGPGEKTGSNPPSSPSNLTWNPLPMRRSDAASVYDDEYARFMRSIVGGDDGSIKTFGTFKSMKSVRSRGEGSRASTMVGSAFETLDEDDVSYQLTSDEEDDEDEEEELLEEGEGVVEVAAPGSPQKRTVDAEPLPPSPMFLAHSEATMDDDLLEVFGEIEGLMEEDLEAAVMASLIGGSESNLSASNGAKGAAKPAASTGGLNKGALFDPQSTMGAIMGTSQQQAITTPGFTTKKRKSTTTIITTPSPVPLNRGGARGASQPPALEVPAVGADQLARLRKMMARHHQLLLQQATLSVRAAYVQKVRKDGISASHSPVRPLGSGVRRKGGSSLPESRLDTKSLTFCSQPDAGCSYQNDFFNGESPEELSECLDGSVGMLQDLEQNWKDAVRNSIQLSSTAPGPGGPAVGESSSHSFSLGADGSRPLTRSAFTKTLLEREQEMKKKSGKSPARSKLPMKAKQNQPSERPHPGRVSVFDVRGLSRLKETFSALDNSVKDIQMGREKGKNKDGINILAPEQHKKACEILLKHARAEIDGEYVPGGQKDMGEILTHAPEAFESAPMAVGRPLTKEQEVELRRNRHIFTAGEDNLILRGVNLYGEKEWCLVSDRFLPDRAVNSISQRYNRLSYIIYKANGIAIDDKGKMPTPPGFGKKGAAKYDVAKAAMIRPARAPTTMNVHRWTLEEDIAILRAVPIMGSAWAEICTKIMPHRDRGHIRKRYQVLERRLPKGQTKMNMKYLRRPVVQFPKPAKSPRRPRAKRSPSKKKTPNKKAAGTPGAVTSGPRPVAPAPSPANIFQQAAAVHKQLGTVGVQLLDAQHATKAPLQPPMSPIKSSPAKSARLPPKGASELQPTALDAIRSAAEHVEREGFGGDPSPETRDVASVLGGFSQSRLDYPHEENTRMGVEKILGNDDWSNASGMQRLIEAGTAESNFVGDRRGTKAVDLPKYQVDDGDASGLSVMNDDNNGSGKDASQGSERKSILSSVMEKTKENARKRKSSAAFPPSTPQRQKEVAHAGYPTSVPTSFMSFTLDTPAKAEGMGLSSSPSKGELGPVNPDMFNYFMSDKSRGATTPGRAATMSPSKALAMNMSPIKLGNLPPTTPLTQFEPLGGVSGPMAGCNSLMASDFDAVAALKDLSSSAPNTPSKLLRPRDGTQLQEAEEKKAAEEGKEEPERKKPRASLLSKVKAKAGERKSG